MADSRDSSVGIATGAGGSLSSPGKAKIFFSSLKRSDRFWGPPSLPCRKHKAPLFPRVTRLADRLTTQLRIRRAIPASPTRSHGTNFTFHQQQACQFTYVTTRLLWSVCVSSQHNCLITHKIRDQPLCSTSSDYTGQKIKCCFLSQGFEQVNLTAFCAEFKRILKFRLSKMIFKWYTFNIFKRKYECPWNNMASLFDITVTVHHIYK